MMKRVEALGLFATWAAVAILLGSMVLGLRAGAAADDAGSLLLAAEAVPASGERVRVEVLNAAGQAGLARAATRVLRERYFDVVYFGNAPRFEGDSSVVIDRVGDPVQARRVADALGISRVLLEPDSSLYLEVTVVLGRDWQGGEAEWPPGPGHYPAPARER